MKCVYSSRYFRIFLKDSVSKNIEISISKKNFKLSVDRNSIKRKIREIYRTNDVLGKFSGGIVFSVFRPFGELSYAQAKNEIEKGMAFFLKKTNEQ
jgi:ribonuclease P protein component